MRWRASKDELLIARLMRARNRIGKWRMGPVVTTLCLYILEERFVVARRRSSVGWCRYPSTLFKVNGSRNWSESDSERATVWTTQALRFECHSGTTARQRQNSKSDESFLPPPTTTLLWTALDVSCVPSATLFLQDVSVIFWAFLFVLFSTSYTNVCSHFCHPSVPLQHSTSWRVSSALEGRGSFDSLLLKCDTN